MSRGICIIGAGTSGIAAARAMQKENLPFVCYEAGSKPGGLWCIDNDNAMSGIYRSLHMNTSRGRSGFSDRPMPDEWPDFPHHSLVLEYLLDYVDFFGLDEHILVSHRVEHVRKTDDGRYAVHVRHDSSVSIETFDVVIVANGHHWDPYTPDFDGTFEGELIHSHDFRDAADFEDQDVLVVGVGNSACDIACELARRNDRVSLSTRSGAHVVPKYLLGRPLDQWASPLMSKLPVALQRLLFRFLVFLARGSQDRYGFPRSEYPLGSEHPTISSDLLNLVGHGRIEPRPGIERMDGRTVHFVDGSRSDFDAVILATGYNITFPFFEDGFLPVRENTPEFYRYMTAPQHENLFFVGLIQPLGPLAPLAEAQSKWIADVLTGRIRLPARDGMFQQIKTEREHRERRFRTSRRHSVEVEFFDYLHDLQSDG